jgi:hypothetical protein
VKPQLLALMYERHQQSALQQLELPRLLLLA